MEKDGVLGALNRPDEQPLGRTRYSVRYQRLDERYSVKGHAAECNDKDASAPFQLFKEKERGSIEK